MVRDHVASSLPLGLARLRKPPSIMISEDIFWLTEPIGSVLALFLGLAVGSFLNVVITRLPMMVESDERQLSLRQLYIEPPQRNALNLIWPRSFCPLCRVQIRWRHNIPLISWLLLRGRCACCERAIPLRYPTVEATTALLTLLLYMHYGPSLEFCFKAFFCLTLIAIAYIDWETGWLPDVATIPLIGAGLIYSIFAVQQLHNVGSTEAIIGASAGYGFFWLLNFVYRTITGRNGLGYGDFKLVAALGAWVGWMLLPVVILLAASIALFFGITMVVRGSYRRDIGIRFAPFLSVVGITIVLADDLGLLPAYIGG